VLPTDVDERFLSSHDDMGERASFHTGVYNSVRTSPHRYGTAFKSKTERFGNDRGSFMHTPLYLKKQHDGSRRLTSSPGYLEYDETPRIAPSIEHALTRSATAIVGADNERRYATTMKSKYEWPKNIEMPINGGGIHDLLDRRVAEDKYGQYSVTEHSIAQNMGKTAQQYKSVFKGPTKDHTICKQASVDFRSAEYENAHPTTMERRAYKSPMNYTHMTSKSADNRFKVRRKATDDVRDWYDIGHSATPDLSVAVERSAILYSGFHATTTHAHNVGKSMPASQRPMSVPSMDYRDPSYEALGSTRRVHCPIWNKASRFLPDGHVLSMIPARVCNNEIHDTTYGTIGREIQTSPIRIKTMSSKTSRTGEVDLCYNPRPGSKLYMTRSKTEWYDGSGKALPDGRMPIADRVASTPQTYISSLQSQTLRSAVPPSMDPRQTTEHERRRQDILEARVVTMREGAKPQISSKMAKILNMEPAPEFKQHKLSGAEAQFEMQRQSHDLHDWLNGPSTPSRQSIASQRAAALSLSRAEMVARKGSRSSVSVGRDRSSKAGVGEEKSAGRSERPTSPLSLER